MASVNTKLNGTRGEYYSITLTYVENSYSVENNTSNVTITGSLKSDSSSYSYYGYTNTGKLSIDGTQVASGSSSTTVDTNGVTLFSYTGNVAHSSDGSKTIALKYDFSTTYSYLSATNLTTNFALTTIPRASTITVNVSTLSITNTSATLGFTATSKGNFYHKLEWKVGSSASSVVSGWNPKQINTTSASGTITTGAILDKMPTSTSGTLTFTLKTYTDSAMTNLTGTSTATCSISINTSNIHPTVSLGTIGVNTPSSFTNLVAGYSTAKVTVTSTNSRGASSFSTSFTISKGSLSANSTSTSSYTLTTKTLPSGKSNYTFKITATITDSRGVSATAEKTSSTVYGYATPVITAKFYRVAESGSSTADPIGTYVYRQFSATQSYTVNGWNNTLTVTAKQDGTTVTSGTTASLADTSTATLVVTAVDKVTTTTKTLTVGTAKFPLDLYDNANGSVGVGLGTTAESNKVRSSMPIVLNSNNGLKSFDSGNTEFNLITYNGTNVWLGARTNGMTHYLGKMYFSSGYNTAESKGNDSVYVAVPNATNTNATMYQIFHEGFFPFAEQLSSLSGYTTPLSWTSGSHDADTAPDGVIWINCNYVSNCPYTSGNGVLVTMAHRIQFFARYTSSGATYLHVRLYANSQWYAWTKTALTT